MNRLKRGFAAILCIVLMLCGICRLPAAAQSVTVNIPENVNIRDNPGTYDTNVIMCTDSAVQATVLGTEKDRDGDEWYHVLLQNGTTGYVYKPLVTVIPPQGEQTLYPSVFGENKQCVMVTDNDVNVRRLPTTTSPVIASAWPCVMECSGKTVNSAGETWYGVITPGGLNGYIRGDYIAEYTYLPDAEFENTLLQFPVNYRNGLRYLHTIHPNWKFYADRLSITLEYAVNMEQGRKIISNEYTSLPESWRTDSGIATLEPGYRHASALALSYTMNPENFIVPVSIFMFMLQTYDSQTQNAQSVKRIVAGSFLDCEDYINYIIEAAAASNVNPDVLAGLILHEQGRAGSALSLGNYPGYEGYYNFYNFGASGSTTEQIIVSGLEYAKEKNWRSPQAAIIGGAVLYGENYVNSNQYNYYYKNFNVINQTWYFQYATGLFDQINNAAQIAERYSGYDSSATFRIPVYAGSNFEEHIHVWSALEHDAAHHYYRCTVCDAHRDEAAHTFTDWQSIAAPPGEKLIKQQRRCTVCGRSQLRVVSSGGKLLDLDGDGEVTDKDAIYLMFYTFFPGDYPIDGSVDYNGDGKITDADAVYLLFFTFFPEDYPI